MDDELHSNIDSRPVCKFTDDPEYIKKFKTPVSEFPEKYAIISMIGNEDVYHDFNAFCASKFVKSYLDAKFQTAVRVIANKYNQMFLKNIETKTEDYKKSVIKKFEDGGITSDEQRALFDTITDVNAFLTTLYNEVKFDDNLSDKVIHDLMDNEMDIQYRKFESDYRFFRDEHLTELEADYRKIEDYNGPIASAFKVRGVHATVEDAKEHAKKLYDIEPYVDTYVASMGKWALWTAAREKVQDTIYMDESLDKLMKRYKENISLENKEFDERYKSSIEHGKQRRKEELRKQALEKHKQREKNEKGGQGERNESTGSDNPK